MLWRTLAYLLIAASLSYVAGCSADFECPQGKVDRDGVCGCPTGMHVNDDNTCVANGAQTSGDAGERDAGKTKDAGKSPTPDGMLTPVAEGTASEGSEQTHSTALPDVDAQTAQGPMTAPGAMVGTTTSPSADAGTKVSPDTGAPSTPPVTVGPTTPVCTPTTERCDSIDNNCNGMIDEGDVCKPACTPTAWYCDADGDGYAVAGAMKMESCTMPTDASCAHWIAQAPTQSSTQDCDDTDPKRNPAASFGYSGANASGDLNCDLHTEQRIEFVDTNNAALNAATPIRLCMLQPEAVCEAMQAMPGCVADNECDCGVVSAVYEGFVSLQAPGAVTRLDRRTPLKCSEDSGNVYGLVWGFCNPPSAPSKGGAPIMLVRVVCR